MDTWLPPVSDLESCLDACADDMKAWSGAKVLVTGGTGFLGRWIASSALFASQQLGLGMHFDFLSRNPDDGLYADYTNAKLIRGDVRSFTVDGTYDLLIHGAANSSAAYGLGDGAPLAMASTILDGTRRIIDIASRSRARLLFLSSGAIYGSQVKPVSETERSAPDPLKPASSYGEAKRMAENYCAIAASEGQVDPVVARLFAFVGPGIPLDAHYAAGNFLSDLLTGRQIDVKGDGRPLRSYLYCGDLPEWCWALINRGQSSSAYNVGSPEPISIRHLAESVAAIGKPKRDVRVALSPGDGPAPCYVPVTDRAIRELSLVPRVGLEQALIRTFTWLRTT